MLLTTCLSVFTFFSCKTSKTTTDPNSTPAAELATTISVQQPVKAGSPLLLTFTVTNNTAKAQKFCKWHTPFEGFKNSYFTITDANGKEAQYKGIMAKRIMPPPADAYMTVAAGKTEKVTVDLLQVYEVPAGKYTITYQGSGISGLEKANEASFVVTQ